MASLFKRNNGYWYISFYEKGKRPSRKQVATGITIERDAEKLLKRRERAYLLGEFDPWACSPAAGEKRCGALQEAVEAFIHSRSNLSSYTVKKYRSVLGLLIDCLGAKRPVTDIRTEDVQVFIDGADRKPVTKKTYSTTLSPFFNRLIDEGIRNDNPTDSLRLQRVPTKFPQFLSPEDVEAICEAIIHSQANKHAADDSGEWLIPIVRANVYLGLRAGEVVNLAWKDVDLRERRLKVGSVSFSTKSSKDRMLPLCEPVASLLRDLPRQSPWVFPNHGGGQLHRAYLSRRFKHYASEEGLAWCIKFHTTRHTCASWLAQRGVPVEAIRLYMGHSSITVTQKYMHLAPDVYADQIARAFSAP